MGLFSKKNEGGFMDVIRCDEENYLVWKWRPAGQAVNETKKENAIRYGSSLRVKDGEMAVFIYKHDNGQVMDYIQGPYDGTIKTDNFPVLTRIVGAAFGGSSPFQAEIYYFNLQGNNQIKFSIPYFDVADPRFIDFTVPIAVRGKLTFNLTDVQHFIKLNRIVDFSLDKFREQILSMVKKFTKNYVTNCPIEQGISVLQIERKIDYISDKMQERLAPQLKDDFGVNLKRLDIDAIEIDKESNDYTEFIRVTKDQEKLKVEQEKIKIEQIGRRAQIDTDIYGRRAQVETDIYAEAGHLQAESQFIQAHAINKQAEVLSTAADNLGQMGGQIQLGGNSGGGMNPAGMMMGMGIAAGMGSQVAGMMGNGMNAMNQAFQQQTPPMAPPPIQTAVSYMLAINGQQYGPYNIEQLKQMVNNGQMTAQTLVWCQGMANWEAAGKRPDLAGLFAPAAPPIPPPPPTE